MRRNLTRSQELEIAKAVEGGSNVKAQAEMYDVSVTRVYRALASLRPTTASLPTWQGRRKMLDDAQEQLLVDCYLTGDPLRAVGEKFSISAQAVLDILRRRGISIRNKSAAWKVRCPPDES